MAARIMKRLAVVVSVASVLVMLGFTSSGNRQLTSQKLDIRVESATGNYFICQAMVRETIIKEMDTLEGRMVTQDMIIQLHEMVNGLPWVKEARVYRTIKANIHVDVRLRDPMFRVINRHNDSYYVDRDGKVFPLSDEHTARVKLVTGHISASPQNTASFADPDEQQDTQEGIQLKSLFELASYISNDAFWNAFIDHVYVRADGQFELTPKNGAHIIEFGHATGIPEKFDKLMAFYRGGITQVGWRYYNRVNIAYTNQVICSK